MRTPASPLVAALLAVGGASACAHGGSGSPMIDDGDTRETVQVRVENENWADMRIYAVRAGTERRLGRVTSLDTRSFEVPRTLMDGAIDLRLVARGLASAETTTAGPIHVNPGDVVVWNLKNDLDLSSYRVREGGGAPAGG